jgi:outer membrane receptor protein involved in Fe transport
MSRRRLPLAALAAWLLAPLPVRAGPPQAPAPPAHAVGPVSTTATRAERELIETPGNVSVIDRKTIERSGARSVPELLRRQSGLSVLDLTTNPAGTSIEARGFQNGGSAGSSLLVLVDGVRANEADNGITDWALLDLDRVERIEIVRGPTSALYGDNAVGGVIHIITRPLPGPPTLRIGGAGGSYDGGRGHALLTGSEGPATLALSAEGLTTDGYRDRAFFRRGDTQGSLALDLGERVAAGVAGGYHADERRFPGALFDFEIASLGRRAASPRTLEDGSEVDRWFVREWLTAQLADGLTLELRSHFHERDDDVVITSLSFGTTSIDFSKQAVGGEAQLSLDRPLGPFASRLVAGGEFLRETTQRGILSAFGPFDTDARRNVLAFFVQEELELCDDLLLSAGARFDQAWYRLEIESGGTRAIDHPDFGIPSPRAALTWRFAPALAAWVAYARGFRLPNYDENSPIETFDPAAPILNPDLDAQESDSFEGGLKLESDRVSAALVGYHMRVHDELVFDPVTFLNQNFDRVDHTGVEASLRAQALERLTLFASYSFEHVEIREYGVAAYEGKRMPLNPLHRGSAGAIVALPGFVEIGWNTNVVGSRWLANDFLHESKRLDAYASHDLFATFRPPLGERVEAALTFALRNVTAEEHADFGARAATTLPDGSFGFADAFNPSARRSFEVGFLVRLRR